MNQNNIYGVAASVQRKKEGKSFEFPFTRLRHWYVSILQNIYFGNIVMVLECKSDDSNSDSSKKHNAGIIDEKQGFEIF